MNGGSIMVLEKYAHIVMTGMTTNLDYMANYYISNDRSVANIIELP